MKRPVTLLLVAALLASGSALAKDQSKDTFTKRVVAATARGNDNRGNDHGNHDRGNGNRGHDNRHDIPRNDHHGDNGNHAPPSYARGNDRHDSRHDWNDHRNDNNHRDWNDHRNDLNGRNDGNRHPSYWDNRRHDRADYARYRYHFGTYHAPRGYYYRSWHRGDRLPYGWYGSSYVVNDWRPYRLYSPPYGYHWVRVGNDVVLTAIATGIVLDVLYNIWY